MPKQTLRQHLPKDLASAAFTRALDDLIVAKALVAEAGMIREASFDADANLSVTVRETARKIEDRFRRGGLQPPDLKDVVAGDKTRQDAARYLLARGRLLAAEDCANDRTVIFHPAAVAHAARLLSKRLTDDGCTVSEINALLGTTRKYSIPLLEHLDATGATRRVGDRRVWNKPRKAALKAGKVES
jgi:selenocysteine-specific elongation factor